MMIDTGIAAVFITILVSLVGMGIAWGTLRERVRYNSNDLGAHKQVSELYRQENREEHKQINNKLDAIHKTIAKNRIGKQGK